jgi:hypothetical protein
MHDAANFPFHLLRPLWLLALPDLLASHAKRRTYPPTRSSLGPS